MNADMPTEPKKINLSVQVPEQLRNDFKRVAEAQKRSMSAQIITLMEREVAKNAAKAA